MLALDLERFLLFEVGDIHVAVVIGILELGERVVMGGALDVTIVDLELLDGLDVVVNDHASGADDGDFAGFTGIEPARGDGGEPAFAECE